jgi:hypothetical protein
MKLLKKYVSQANDWADYTGRYKATDISTVPVLITMKDEFAKAYLKAVNDALEKQINEWAAIIQEPIPLLESSKISGTIGTNPFKVRLEGTLDPNMYSYDAEKAKMSPNGNRNAESFLYKFNYKNDVNNKLYVNGVDANILESPKQCSVYMGSTKNEYYDANGKFDPEKVNGEYSIMTRAMRSDNIATAKGVRTVGVNTRLLSPKETYKATGWKYGADAVNGKIVYGTEAGGKTTSGAIVEDNPAYGISAFSLNPMQEEEKYANVLELKGLKKDDVLWKIESFDGKDPTVMTQTFSSSLSFDNAIEIIYQKAKASADTKVGDKNEENVGTFTLHYFRGSTKGSITATFTAKEGSELANKKGSEGAIFTLYSMRSDKDIREGNNPDNGNGYAGNGYDNSAGCNYVNTMFYSDRCMYPVAMMPVLDPAGSMTLVPRPDDSGKLVPQFPENGTDANHTDMFPYPAGKYVEVDKTYVADYSAIDDVYMNSCYRGISSLDTEEKKLDSNEYDFPLDAGEKHDFPSKGDYMVAIGIPEDFFPVFDIAVAIAEAMGLGTTVNIDKDYQSLFLQRIGKFVEEEADINYEEKDENGKSISKEKPLGVDRNVPPSLAGDPWSLMRDLSADKIILNTEPLITLKHFSDRYGLFDGIDNDKNGVIDDAAEASSEYGINSKNMDEVARKLLSKDKSYFIPAASLPSEIGQDITLNVKTNPYASKTTIPSMILHNEPTAYTIYPLPAFC